MNNTRYTVSEGYDFLLDERPHRGPKRAVRIGIERRIELLVPRRVACLFVVVNKVSCFETTWKYKYRKGPCRRTRFCRALARATRPAHPLKHTKIDTWNSEENRTEHADAQLLLVFGQHQARVVEFEELLGHVFASVAHYHGATSRVLHKTKLESSLQNLLPRQGS